MAAAIASAAGGTSTSTIVAEEVTGSHVLKIDGYSRTKWLGVGKYIKSSTFSIGGHSWYIKYYPDGINREDADWICVSLHLDHPVPDYGVKAQVKFSLLDQAGEPIPKYTVAGLMCKLSSYALGWSLHDMYMLRKDVESSAYLKDDSFSVRCDVTVVQGFRAVATATEPTTLPPPTDLHRHLGDLLASGVGGDVTFEVGGEQFTAHRNVLAARSTVFMAELYGLPMKEKTTSVVRVDDMEARVFRAMLHFIYTDSLPPEVDKGEDDPTAMAQHLLVAADRYNLERLKLICEDLLRGCIDVNMAGTTLVLAEQHGCRGLKDACFRFLKRPGNLNAVMATEGFQHLKCSCPSLLEELLANVAP